jgi:predicted acyltransferase
VDARSRAADAGTDAGDSRAEGGRYAVVHSAAPDPHETVTLNGPPTVPSGLTAVEPARLAAVEPARLASVDALRGLTIAGMIVVNDPGTWSAVYPPLLHAEWHGWTPTDTIFPFFLFIAGVSLALSIARRRREGASDAALLRRVAGRGALLFVVGLALNIAACLALHPDHFRIMGVLQRIGLCVLGAGVALVLGGGRAAAISAAVLLVGYWAAMRWVPVPDCGTGRLDPRCSLASFVDRAVLGSHTFTPEYDPEGLLSTLPAIATTLLGAAAGERLLRRERLRGAATWLALAGAAAAGAGLIWSLVFPINKSLWTSSYALFMSGLAAILLAGFVALIDQTGWRLWAAPFVGLGRNAIAAFLASDIVAGAMLAIRVGGPDGRPMSLWRLLYTSVFDRFDDPRIGSLLFALAYLVLWIAVFALLDRKRIYFKI